MPCRKWAEVMDYLFPDQQRSPFALRGKKNRVHLPRLLDRKANELSVSLNALVILCSRGVNPTVPGGVWQACQQSARGSLEFLRAQRGMSVFPQYSVYTSDMSHIALHCNYVLHACPMNGMRSSKSGIFLSRLYPQVGLPIQIQDAQLKLNVK